MPDIYVIKVKVSDVPHLYLFVYSIGRHAYSNRRTCQLVGGVAQW